MEAIDTKTAYQLLAKAVLYKALIDAQHQNLLPEVTLFMQGQLYKTFCDMAGIPPEFVQSRVIRPKTKPRSIDIFQDGVSVAHCRSISKASHATEESTSTVWRYMQLAKPSPAGFIYRSESAR